MGQAGKDREPKGLEGREGEGRPAGLWGPMGRQGVRHGILTEARKAQDMWVHVYPDTVCGYPGHVHGRALCWLCSLFPAGFQLFLLVGA